MPLVLVVDDVAALAEQYAYDLKRVGGYDTRIATGGQEALDAVESEVIDCVILDLEMPGVDGFEVLRKLKKRGLQIPIIVYTGTGNYDRCVKAVKLGAFSFVDKSEPMERVAQEVENALERVRLELEIESLRKSLGTDTPLLGSSDAMRVLKQQVERLAPIPSAVLITGESGTGKELVARELHRLGADGDKPFVAINSAALPENLIESELFGHERGAFTGANRTRKGAFELASGGTLFLDEIGELPLPAQAKMLRVLEQNQVTRLGGERVINVSARVVAATNRELDTEVQSGRFRQDLFYRLAVHTIRVPPLRERLSDIPDLADRFLTDTCGRFGVRRKTIEPDALEVLMDYEWRQNNVRELKNIIERMIIASDTPTITISHVPAEIRSGGEPQRDVPPAGSLKAMKAEAERRIIVSALERNGWQITRTAVELGLADHASLLKIMRRHHIKKP
ncbi:MAG: sigma-54-dependent Fis family transcriptional regulator [Candidatus Latescibacterota bacterium]|nr:MAG: sigma-54-dependent Fis family transcriptional regulator [Candidatus Latescibacterota bacterium]